VCVNVNVKVKVSKREREKERKKERERERERESSFRGSDFLFNIRAAGALSDLSHILLLNKGASLVLSPLCPFFISKRAPTEPRDEKKNGGEKEKKNKKRHKQKRN